MSNTYKATSAAAAAAFADGVFERDFTPSEEKDWLDSGLLVLVPRTYRVLSNNYEAAGQGETFEGALLKEHEQGLLWGGHIERVASKGGSTKKTAAVSGDEKKED